MEDLAEIINDPEVKLDIPQPEDVPAPPIIQVLACIGFVCVYIHVYTSFIPRRAGLRRWLSIRIVGRPCPARAQREQKARENFEMPRVSFFIATARPG